MGPRDPNIEACGSWPELIQCAWSIESRIGSGQDWCPWKTIVKFMLAHFKTLAEQAERIVASYRRWYRRIALNDRPGGEMVKRPCLV